MDQLQNSSQFLPWVSFIAGFGGSLHCLGMCGGLVTATCQQTSDVFKYQIGRLVGYLILGFFAGVLGKIFTLQVKTPLLTFIPGVLIGGLFLYWGLQSFLGKKAELPTPKFLKSLYQSLWKKWIQGQNHQWRGAFIGLISILLPCGLLYGVVLGLVSFEHSFKALYGMFFFWLGTLPSMVVAPTLMTKFLRPLKAKLPKAFGVALMFLGITTISARVYLFEKRNLDQENHTQTQSSSAINGTSENSPSNSDKTMDPKHMHCH